MSSNEQLYEKISKSVAHHEQDLADICKKIHENPEFNYKEFKAHDNICDLMHRLGYNVKRSAYGIQTSFEVESGQNGKLIVFNAEYDALPGLGHACGHNLIATSSIAAFIATAETIRSLNIPGRVRLLGTPAEEGGGGKVHLIKAGAYEGVDACLMAHPTGKLSPQGEKNIDGVSAARSSARRQMKVAFTGQNAHAGNTPWHGKNALDAVVSSYVNISLLRQQIQPTERIHGVIRNGGAEPNIIPDSTNLEYYLRAAGADQIKELTGRVEACFKAGAIATGCEVKCSCESDQDYMELRPNLSMSNEFTKHMHAFGRDYIGDANQPPMGASTDMGNVTYCVPGIHPMFAVGTQDPMIQPHTPKFAEAAGTREAFERALDCAKGLAATAWRLIGGRPGAQISLGAWARPLTNHHTIPSPIEMAQTFVEDVLPPEGIYNSREALLAAINSWAKPRGYAFTTGKSTKTANGRVKVVYACDRNKQPPSSSAERVRRTSSRRTGCKFSVLAKESRDGSTWTLGHRPDKECAEHNHPPSEHPSAHPAHRRFEEQDAATVSNLAKSGATARDIRTYLHNHSETLATQRDIYNRIAETRRDLREGQSSIQALVDQLHKEGFWCRIRLDPENRLTAIFFAHPDSVAYLQYNPDVLLLDCTYKTNKHHMPLLDMVGVDSCQRSFCIAFAFLSGESEEDYSWALEHLRSLYQHELPSVILTDRCLAAMNAAATWFSSSKALLCLWHVNKAIVQHCRPLFASPDDRALDQADGKVWDEFYAFWHLIVASPDEQTFEERLAEFELKYGSRYLESVGYIKMYWLEPYKEKIVKAWVDEHLHFGNVATSRAEGIHSLIKSHIKTSTFDLFDVWQAMKHAITNQLKELKHVRATQQLRTPLEVSGVLFEAVRGWVSHQALRKVQEQRQLLQKPHKARCSNTFTSSHGLPCVHTLKKFEEERRALLLDDFHPHWHLKRDVTRPRPMLEPARAGDRLDVQRARPKTTTKRGPSGFEMVEHTKRAPSTCSRCHTVGHTMASKSCPLKFSAMPMESARILEPILQACTASGPVSADRAETPARSEYMPCPDANKEASAEARQHRGSAEPAALGRPPPSSPIRIVPQLPTIIDSPALTSPSIATEAPRAKEVSIVRDPLTQLPLRYDSPEAIYSRYVAARSVWYAAQPRGSIKTNQEYRKAKGLPQRYDKRSYEWCLDFKQMSKRCVTQTGSREWTKEEMMAYLDWCSAEDKRVEAQVAREMGDNPLATKRRGMKDIWKSAEKDSREQQALHSVRDKTERCIIVKM